MTAKGQIRAVLLVALTTLSCCGRSEADYGLGKLHLGMTIADVDEHFPARFAFQGLAFAGKRFRVASGKDVEGMSHVQVTTTADGVVNHIEATHRDDNDWPARKKGLIDRLGEPDRVVREQRPPASRKEILIWGKAELKTRPHDKYLQIHTRFIPDGRCVVASHCHAPPDEAGKAAFAFTHITVVDSATYGK